MCEVLARLQGGFSFGWRECLNGNRLGNEVGVVMRRVIWSAVLMGGCTGSESWSDRGPREWALALDAGVATGRGEGQIDWSRHVGKIGGQVWMPRVMAWPGPR